MKIFKKFVAVLGMISILLSLTACHKKDEIALSVDGVDITSALYMNALIECDLEARQRIDEENESSTGDIDYFAQKLDNMTYTDYVKSKAIDRCKEYAFYQKQADKKVISLTDEEKSEAEYYATTYWSYYGYNTLFEPNGVSLETYKKANVYTYYSNKYFMYLYDEGGSKEVSKDDIKKTMNDKYILVYALSETYDEDATDEEKSTLKNKYQAYADRLAKGEDFAVIYEEINGKEDDTTGIDVSELETGSESEKSDGETTENLKPKDDKATIIGDEDTNYSSSDYDTVDEMKVGEVKLIENEDKTGFTVYKKLDINSDEYYLTQLKDEILYTLKQKEFDTLISSETDLLKAEENKYAINRFKVKKIVYPEGA